MKLSDEELGNAAGGADTFGGPPVLDQYGLPDKKLNDALKTWC